MRLLSLNPFAFVNNQLQVNLNDFAQYPTLGEGARASNFIRLFMLPTFIESISGDDTVEAIAIYKRLVDEIINSGQQCIPDMLLDMLEGARPLPTLFVQRPDYLVSWASWLAWGDERFFANAHKEYRVALEHQREHRMMTLEQAIED
jgi:hypothetical protein